MVGDGEPGQPQLDRPLDQVVRRARRRRGTRSWCGSGARRTGSGATGRSGRPAGWGPVSIEHPFCLDCHVRHRDQGGSGRTAPIGVSLARCDRPTRRRRHRRPALASCCRRHAAARPAGPSRAGRAAAAGIRPRVTGIAPLTKEVYGYLPYWRLDSGTVDRLDYDLVSTIAFFGLGIKTDGNIDTAWVGYKDYVGDDAAAVTNAAHAKGVRVVPTFQLFDSGALPKMTRFLDSTAAQTRFIKQALDLMAAARPTARTSTSSRCPAR